MHRRYEPMRNNSTPHPSANADTFPSRGRQGNTSSTASGQNARRTVRDTSPYNQGEGRQGNGNPTTSGQNTKRTVGGPGPYRQGEQNTGKSDIHKKSDANFSHPITKFIPQSVYDPKTGKILGFLSAEDLLILGLIFLLLDSGDECEDNSFLIYALIYILISGHTDLPF